jgi:hypothetical protein
MGKYIIGESWGECLALLLWLNMVTPSVFIQLGSFNYRWESTLLANHGVSIWHCLSLLLWLNMIIPSVFIQLDLFNYR